MYSVEDFSSVQNKLKINVFRAFLMPEKADLTGPLEAIIQCILLVNTIFDTTALFIS